MLKQLNETFYRNLRVIRVRPVEDAALAPLDIVRHRPTRTSPATRWMLGSRVNHGLPPSFRGSRRQTPR